MPRDPVAARAWYRQAAKQGSGAACLQLGIIYATGQTARKNYTTAARWYAQAAVRGVADGYYNLAFLHLRGLGVAQDTARALRLLEQAADGGSIPAAWALHRQYTDGEHVPIEPTQASRWLVRAAELGSAAAACLLARQLERNDSSSPPVARVMELLEGCAVRGDPDAQSTLALMYLRNHVPQDERQALRWFTRAAQGGNAFAQTWLGDILMQGRGVPADRDAAALWYERAALQGHAGAIAAVTSMRMAGGARGEELA
jgi:hypothetical protein